MTIPVWDDISWIFTSKRILPEECYRSVAEWQAREIREHLERWLRLVEYHPRGYRGSLENYHRVDMAIRLLEEVKEELNGHRLQSRG